MKYNELKNQSAKDLLEQNNELRNELFQLRLKSKTAQLENKSRLRSVRRDIARIQTKLSELNNQKASKV